MTTRLRSTVSGTPERFRGSKLASSPTTCQGCRGSARRRASSGPATAGRCAYRTRAAPTCMWPVSSLRSNPLDRESSSGTSRSRDGTPVPETPVGKVSLDAADGTSPLEREMLESGPPSRGPSPTRSLPRRTARSPSSACSTDEYFELHGMRYKGVDAVRTEAEVPGCSTLNEAQAGVPTVPPGSRTLQEAPDTGAPGGWPGATANRGLRRARACFVWPGPIKVGRGPASLHTARGSGSKAVGQSVSRRSGLQANCRWPATKTDRRIDELGYAPGRESIFKLPSSFGLGAERRRSSERSPGPSDEVPLHPRRVEPGTSRSGARPRRPCPDRSPCRRTLGKDKRTRLAAKGRFSPPFANALAEQFPWPDLEVVDSLYRPSSVAPGGTRHGCLTDPHKFRTQFYCSELGPSIRN